MGYCRRGIPFVVWMLVGMLAMAACQEPAEHGGKTPLVQVEDQYLYAEDVARVLPFGLSPADSAAFVKDYLRKWAEEQALYKQAERNVNMVVAAAQGVDIAIATVTNSTPLNPQSLTTTIPITGSTTSLKSKQ